MIIGVGIDLVENRRFEAELARGDWSSADGIFTENEIIRSRRLRRKSQAYASCFAAKEATLKALNIDVSGLSLFRNIELGPEHNRRYELHLQGLLKKKSEQLGVKQVRVSIAHDAKHTIAMVLVEG